MTYPKLAAGIAAGIAAGALWGLVFLMPLVLPEFTTTENALGRFFFFGLVSLFGLPRAAALFRGFTARERLEVLLLSASGFWLYTILMFWSVRACGGVATTLMVGTLPITIPLAAKKTLRLPPAFISGLALIAAGVVALVLPGLLRGGVGGISPLGFLGLLSLVAGWTWYAVRNAAFMARHPEVSFVSMTCMMGLASFAALLLIALFVTDMGALMAHERLGRYIFWSVLTGAGSGWAACLLWNRCSGLCPPGIAGPLIVAETLFGLTYTFLCQQRWPEPNEAAAILLFGAGVVIAIRSEKKGLIPAAV